MSFSNTRAAAILNQEFRGPAVYLALYTSNPTGNDTGTEVTGGGYVRRQIIFTAPTIEGGKQTIKNTAEIQFPIATANWGTVTHVGIRTAATGGTLISHGPLLSPRTIETGDRYVIDLNNGVQRLS